MQKYKLIITALLVLASIHAAFGQSADAADANHKGQRCTAANGQRLIDQGRYEQAIREFTCLIEADPANVEGYRGRIEALLLLGRYSDALSDYGRVTAFVLPVYPDARQTILDSYAARLALAPDNITALMGMSFALWSDFDYASSIQSLNQLLELQPDHVYGNLFRGSSRLLRGVTRHEGVADLDRALSLAPQSADVRFIVADAYTYGLPDPERAFAEATLALNWGLNTPRVHAILAAAYLAFGDQQAAAIHIQTHINSVTTELVPAPELTDRSSLALELVPGRTYEIPVPAIAGETISIMATSRDYWDTILILLAPDGTPVLGSDDFKAYFAGFDWVAESTATYRLQVTFFESVNTGELVVTRD